VSCDARIRPFPDETEVGCEQDADDHIEHVGVLRDYAYPGSTTYLRWYDDDRRNFHGEWPGACGLGPCTLPTGHNGRCAP